MIDLVHFDFRTLAAMRVVSTQITEPDFVWLCKLPSVGGCLCRLRAVKDRGEDRISRETSFRSWASVLS